ncbi:UNKNOWN [Stylonychia lemnae]|uniref:Transmembrane protein n=1 Tax=Stylonychia lemnae TaxID=5949 RepID=A0A078BC07_STYLE|nr:UNKNOWN [Stylonychia lemnae]|eukprot:CDW91746.1 UNKNOWN [Stylonychia lemnae]
MDLKVLFHNPDELTDVELHVLRNKIQQQQLMPYFSAGIAGFGMYVLDNKILRRFSDWKRIALAASAGFVIGAIGSYQVRSTIQRKLDMEIVEAFETRYAQTALNMSGFGNNHLNAVAHSVSNPKQKPY